jgi:acetyltransferase-like isoleucine patch superfamily enzyme
VRGFRGPRWLVSRSQRQAALVLARLRWRRVRFGERCDLRRRLLIRLGPNARVSFGDQCILDRDLTVECEGTLSVGDRTSFGHHCTIGVKGSVRIGSDCLIAELVSIRDSDHVFADRSRPYRLQGHATSPIEIGNNVWIGSQVVVTRGVCIGDNSVVGAGSVVTASIPPNCLAAGAPARVIRGLGSS